jgi:flap endonuclease-1
MGIKNLQKLILDYAPNAIKKTTYNDYTNKIIAVDTSILIYQYVIAIRNNGIDLETSDGRITSHIHGIISKALNLLEIKIKPIFVFDGKPPQLKSYTLKNRKKNRKKAIERMENEQNEEERIKLFKRSVVVTATQLNECKEILKLMGLPVVDSVEEADSTCAYLVKNNLAYATASEDMDILTFGSTRLVRNLTSKKNKNKIMEISLNKILEDLDINYDQFIEICILLGCDYSDTIKGIGYKRAYSLIKKYGNIENFLKNEPKVQSGYFKITEYFYHKESKDYFLNAPVGKILKKDLKWKKPSYNKLRETLVEKYEFNLDKVNKLCNRLKKTNYKISGNDFFRKNNKKNGYELKKNNKNIMIV